MDVATIVCPTFSSSAGPLGLHFRLSLGRIGSLNTSGNHGCMAGCTSFSPTGTGPLARDWMRPSHASNWSMPDDGYLGRPAGYERRVMAESVSQLCEQGQLIEAVEALGVLVQTDCRVSRTLFYSVIKKCAVEKDLVVGRCVHALVVRMGCESDTFLCNHIMRMYASQGRLQEAMEVFTVTAVPDAFMWSSIISAHVTHGQAQQAIQLYHDMRGSSVKPDGHVFVAALQACAKMGDLGTGQQVHADVLARDTEPHLIVSNCLVDMYAKCGSLKDARRVFDGLRQRDVVTWTALIAGYSQQGMGEEALDLYGAMQEEGVAAPNAVTFVSLLQACAIVGSPALERGKQLHARTRERALETDVSVANSLVNMYAKCGSLEDAQRMFDGLCQKDVVTWTALLAGYSHQGMGQEALQLYSAMQEEGVAAPNAVTFLSLLQACASMGTPALEKGKQLHAEIREQGLEFHVLVGSGLVNMYAKCGSLEDAQRVFDGLVYKDVVTWTTLIAGYSQQGMGLEALQIYGGMQEESISVPNAVTYVSLLQACASVGTLALEKGKQLHQQIAERGLKVDVVVGCSLVNMYAKCGSLEHAQDVFDGLSIKNLVTWATLITGYAKSGKLQNAQRMFDQLLEKDVVTWNAMIAGYSQQGMGQEALALYSIMQDEDLVAPDSVTYVSLLQACASVGNLALEKGKELHAQIREKRLQADVLVANSLVYMYAKCGSLEDAQRIFDGLAQKDVVTWNAMISGYSQQGMGQEALCLYKAMQEGSLIAPDSVTYVCLLKACANVAALRLGRQLHAQIAQQGLHVDVLVATSLINMYSKAGSMVDAQQVFDSLIERDDVVWNSLIAGYTRQGDSKVVFDLFRRMRWDGIEPTGITFLSVLTVCSHKGLVHEGQQYFKAMSRHYGITPTTEHYTCMVDLLGRAGQLEEAVDLVRTIPVQSNAAVWHALLSACQKWGDVELGYHAFDEAVKVDKMDAAAYVLMSNIYTGAQMWEQAHEMQTRRTGIRAWKQPGQCWWTDMDGLVHNFLVGDERRVSEAERP